MTQLPYAVRPPSHRRYTRLAVAAMILALLCPPLQIVAMNIADSFDVEISLFAVFVPPALALSLNIIALTTTPPSARGANTIMAVIGLIVSIGWPIFIVVIVILTLSEYRLPP